MPTPPKGAKWTEPPKVVTRLNYRSDRIGFTDEALPPHLRDPGRRRHAAADHERRLEPLGAELLARRQVARVLVVRVPGRRARVSASRRSTPRTSRRARSSSSRTQRARTATRPISPDGKLIAFMSADSIDHSAWAETKLCVMNADGSNRASSPGTFDRPISGVMWATTTAASTSTSRAKARRTCTSRRSAASSARGDERHAAAHGQRRRQERRSPSACARRRPSLTTS